MLKLYKSSEFGLAQVSTFDKGVWIKLTAPTDEEINQVSAFTKVPPDFLRAALDEEERSHIELEDDQILVIINVPVLRGDNHDALPLGIILTDDYFVTVSLENNPIIDSFIENSGRGFFTYKRTRFLFQILHKTAMSYLQHLKTIDKKTSEIERGLHGSMKNKELFRLMELGKSLVYFNTSLRSNGIVMERLLRLRSSMQETQIIKLYPEDEDLLEDVIVENKQAIEMAEVYSHIINSMTGTFASVISNNQNMVMKFLASMTIILALPTMVSSFFGMNVPLPFHDDPLGFAIIVIISVALAGFAIFMLNKREML